MSPFNQALRVLSTMADWKSALPATALTLVAAPDIRKAPDYISFGGIEKSSRPPPPVNSWISMLVSEHFRT